MMGEKWENASRKRSQILALVENITQERVDFRALILLLLWLLTLFALPQPGHYLLLAKPLSVRLLNAHEPVKSSSGKFNLNTAQMSDLSQIQTFTPKIFGSLLVSALASYLGWKAIEKVLFKDPNKMFRWFSSSSPPKLLQDPETKYEVPLIAREEVSHDTRKFKFGLPSDKHVLGLPIGQHVHLTTTVDGQLVIRPYTPTSSDDDHGFFELVIKVYFKNVHPKFPDGGKMSQYLENMKIGDTIQVRGPSGRLEYHGKGNFAIRADKKAPPAKKHYKKVSMIAGGTGIAPMLQIIRDILKKTNQDKTEIALLFANQTEKDILLRDELEDLLAKHPSQFKLWYTIDRPEDGWKYSSGFVSKDMIGEHLHAPDDDTIILMCGPPPMIKFVQSQLDELNYPEEHRFKY